MTGVMSYDPKKHDRIRQYIEENPARWHGDRHYAG